jgi:benzoyl-CoA 2,3-dioxygenase component B
MNASMDNGLCFDPEGKPISRAEWDHRHEEFLPSAKDRAYVQALMQPVTEPGKIAGWIAPPARGINGQPFEFEYVRHHVA